jgi:hypothetical protein
MKYVLLIVISLCFNCLSIAQTDSHIGNISIKFTKFGLPSYIFGEPHNMKVVEFSKDEKDSLKNYLEKILKKYPEEILQKNLRTIYIFKNIEIYNAPAGGTYFLKEKFVLITKHSDNFLERAFHHEFSSILLESFKPKISIPQWEAINPKGFIYPNNAKELLNKVYSGFENLDSFNRSGFLHEYGQSDFENDFNSFAEGLLMDDEQFWQKVYTYPKIREKFKLILKFYHSIHPEFKERLSKKYFLKMLRNKELDYKTMLDSIFSE